MKVTQLYIYPIKSLRAVPLQTAQVTSDGFQYDRRFILVKHHPTANTRPRAPALFDPQNRLESVTITFYPELSLFKQRIDFSKGLLYIDHCPPDHSDWTLEIPLEPDCNDLEDITISLHQSSTKGHLMPDWASRWFSTRLEMDVKLIYLGSHRRDVLGNLAPAPSPPQPTSWLSSLSTLLPSGSSPESPGKTTITFTDCAAILVVTEESLQDVSARFSNPTKADITKFRPNIVLSGSPHAYDEDFWGGIRILKPPEPDHANNDNDATEIVLTQNCGRCQSLNVDYTTGQFSKDEEGATLKKLMKDRRVDTGNKYSPVFGRYGFMKTTQNDGNKHGIRIGDEVEVSKRNEERTSFSELTEMIIPR